MSVADRVQKRIAGVAVSSSLPAEAGALLIGTHDGNFHCDEAMACSLLRHTARYAGAPILRTRDPALLASATVVVDVGGVYDEATQRFDHHQKEFNGTMTTPLKTYNTRLSSAGLVYRHFGMELLKDYATEMVAAGRLQKPLSEDELNVLFDRVYKMFVEHVDGIDNGVEEFSGEGISRNYRVTTSLSSRVGSLFPRWNEPSTPEDQHKAFVKAMELTGTEFFECVDYYAAAWLPARGVVQSAVQRATEVHESGKIVVLTDGGCPWKEHLFDIEREMGIVGRSLYVLFQDAKGGWRVMCVGVEGAAFENRKSLPWRGLRDADLDKESGISGCVFVHVGGFIGGNKTFDGAKAMAVKALSM